MRIIKLFTCILVSLVSLNVYANSCPSTEDLNKHGVPAGWHVIRGGGFAMNFILAAWGDMRNPTDDTHRVRCYYGDGGEIKIAVATDDIIGEKRFNIYIGNGRKIRITVITCVGII